MAGTPVPQVVTSSVPAMAQTLHGAGRFPDKASSIRLSRPTHSDGTMSAPIELTYPVFSRPVAVGVRVG